MVRIPGFHPGDPGSIPGRGKKIFNFASRTHSHIRIICELGLVQWLEFAVANGEARVRFSDSAFILAVRTNQASVQAHYFMRWVGAFDLFTPTTQLQPLAASCKRVGRSVCVYVRMCVCVCVRARSFFYSLFLLVQINICYYLTVK